MYLKAIDWDTNMRNFAVERTKEGQENYNN